MADSTERTEAHRLINEAFADTTFGSSDYPQQVIDLVYTATSAHYHDDHATAIGLVQTHITNAQQPDRAAYHLCGAAAIATGALLDGNLIYETTLTDADTGDAASTGSVDLVGIGIHAVNAASVDDHPMLSLLLDVVWRIHPGLLHQLATTVIGLRADVLTMPDIGTST